VSSAEARVTWLHVRFFTATAPNALGRPGEAFIFRAKPPPAVMVTSNLAKDWVG